jgi:LmbE family N-acetylglucosaminyl deacetylase
LQRLSLDEPGKSPTVLCIGAHCDDIEIGCGATLLRLVREYPGVKFVWAVFAGSAERERESRQAAAELLRGAAGVELRYLGFGESYFPSHYDRIKDGFETLKSQVTPDLIFTHRLEDRHQDHRILAELSWNTFRSHLILEYEIPKYEGDLGHPNFFVQSSAADMDRKIDILMRCFASQTQRSWFTPDTFRALARIRGIECVAPGGFAEAFHARKLCF